MPIPDVNEAQLVEILSTHFSPSKEIDDPKRLVGREKLLTQIRRALYSPGRHVFIHGERGVGKTSLARIAGEMAVQEQKNFIYIPCGEQTTFFEVIQAVGNSVISVDERIAGSGHGLSLGGNVFGYGGANVTYNQQGARSVHLPKNMSEAYDVLRFLRQQMNGQIIIAIDELDRVKSLDEKNFFAELLKNIGSIVPEVRFMLCGIGANVNEILGEHISTGRMFEPVEVERLAHNKLWEIISDVAARLEVEVDGGYLLRIGVISDGFPHYVHLIGECLFYAMNDDPSLVMRVERKHFDEALHSALQKAEPPLRKIYQMATEKSKNMAEYEEALWALADRTSTRRQVKEIYEASYIRIANARGHKPLPRETFNSRLLTLRKDSHANIIIGHGSGWFSFRENVVRGYARLKAESLGVSLATEVTV